MFKNIRKEDYIKTLKDISYDKCRKEYTTNCMIKAYAFDSMSKIICKRLRGECLSSCDAFYESKDGDFYFIEFKNEPQGNVKTIEIKNKAFDSCSMLPYTLFLGLPLINVIRNLNLIVVYNNNKRPIRDKDYYNEPGALELLDHDLGIMAGIDDPKPKLLFNLDRIEGNLYKKIWTINIDAFEKNFIGKIIV